MPAVLTKQCCTFATGICHLDRDQYNNELSPYSLAKTLPVVRGMSSHRNTVFAMLYLHRPLYATFSSLEVGIMDFGVVTRMA